MGHPKPFFGIKARPPALLKLKCHQGVEIIRPTQFLKLLSSWVSVGFGSQVAPDLDHVSPVAVAEFVGQVLFFGHDRQEMHRQKRKRR